MLVTRRHVLLISRAVKQGQLVCQQERETLTSNGRATEVNAYLVPDISFNSS